MSLKRIASQEIGGFFRNHRITNRKQFILMGNSLKKLPYLFLLFDSNDIRNRKYPAEFSLLKKHQPFGLRLRHCSVDKSRAWRCRNDHRSIRPRRTCRIFLRPTGETKKAEKKKQAEVMMIGKNTQ